MSLSKPKVSVSSPVKRYYTWSGSEGHLVYWDKDQQKKITQSLPFVFITIDQLSCVEGYSQKHEKGFRSNEVRSTKEEELNVRWNAGGTIVKGIYSTIKDAVEKLGGKYHRSIYGVELIEGEYHIVNLKFKGAAMSSWLNFDKSIRGGLEGLNITINKSELKKVGRVEYYEPVFNAGKPSVDEYETAVDLDRQLQEYFVNKNESQADFFTEELTPDEKAQLVKPHNNTDNNEVFMSADDIFQNFD